MKYQKSTWILLILNIFTTVTIAQNVNFISNSDSISLQEVNYTDDTFFSTRVINGHSTEGITQGRLDLRVEHRFGLINQGYSEFFGLDQAYTFFGLEYGIKDWMMVGINRTSTDKSVSAFTKLSLLRQSTGIKNMPVSISFFLGTSVIGMQWSDPVQNNDFNSRVNYIAQLLIAHKCSNNISLQLSPVWIHRNKVLSSTDNKDLFALGISAEYKITPLLSINTEYYPVINPSNFQKLYYSNSLSFGLDIKTAGHVFQIIVSNATDMIEKGFIGGTSDKWLNGDLHLGFNILRKFDL